MAYIFEVNSVAQKVYCHMTDLTGCGLGGWTLTMKIDGTKVKRLINRKQIIDSKYVVEANLKQLTLV